MWKLSGLPPNYEMFIINCINISIGIFSCFTCATHHTYKLIFVMVWCWLSFLFSLTPQSRHPSFHIASHKMRELNWGHMKRVESFILGRPHIYALRAISRWSNIHQTELQQKLTLALKTSTESALFLFIMLHIMIFYGIKVCSKKYIYSSVISPFIFSLARCAFLPLSLSRSFAHHDIPLLRWENHMCVS
jgi:hypothetical protein